MSETLDDDRSTNPKPVLRVIYDDLYACVAAACVPGMTIGQSALQQC
jgi:hypothetical protein